MSRWIGAFSLVVLALCSACQAGWSADPGPRSLSAAAGPEGTRPARGLSLTIPEGWHWYERGRDLIATRDGVFLQNLLVERISVGETAQSVAGLFPVAALSSKQWPTRTAKNLRVPLRGDMSPLEAAEALLGSRRNDPALVELSAGEVSHVTVAGHSAFAFELSFRVDPRGPQDLEWPFYGWSEYDVRSRRVPYRSLCRGFLLDDWLYLITYTATRRHYFDQDLATFEAFLASLRLMAAEPDALPAGNSDDDWQ